MIHRQDRQTNFLRFFGNTDLRSYATFSFRNEGKSCKINIFLIAFQLSFLFNYYFFFLTFLTFCLASCMLQQQTMRPPCRSTLFHIPPYSVFGSWPERETSGLPLGKHSFDSLFFPPPSRLLFFFFFFSVVCGSVYTRWRSPPSIEKNAGDDHFPTLCVCAYVRHQPSPLPYTHRHTCVRARTSPHALTLLILNSVQGEMQGG